MGSMKVFFVCSLLAAACAFATGQPCSGVKVGDLPDLNHNVSGQFYVEDDTTYCITDFYYDGAGPDAFLYLYYPGDSTFIKGGGVYTKVPGQDRIQFEIGRKYLGETFRFQVPEGHRTCDYGAFGIWCRYASQLFTVITIQSPTFNVTTGGISCTPSPGRGYVGALPMNSNGISGDLFVRDSKTFGIRDFNYDGQGSSASVYLFPVGVTPDATSEMSGTMISNGFMANIAYDDEQLMITIPDDVDVYTCDVGTFTILDPDADMFYTELSINTNDIFTNNPALADHDRSLVHCDRPATRPGVLVGELPNIYHGVEGTFYVQDDKTFYIQLFSYDGEGPAAYLYYYRRGPGRMVEDTGHGYKINASPTQTSLPTGISNSYKKHTPFIVDLNNAAEEDDVRACDVGWFTIWCEDFDAHFTEIQIPENIFTTDPDHQGIAMKNRVLCTQTEEVPTPREGTGGAPPAVSLLSAFTACVIALGALLFRA